MVLVNKRSMNPFAFFVQDPGLVFARHSMGVWVVVGSGGVLPFSLLCRKLKKKIRLPNLFQTDSPNKFLKKLYQNLNLVPGFFTISFPTF